MSMECIEKMNLVMHVNAITMICHFEELSKSLKGTINHTMNSEKRTCLHLPDFGDEDL